MRVVVGEDHALLRDLLTRLLMSRGFEIAGTAEDAATLREALADPLVDAAVVDVRMPPTFTDEGLREAIAARTRRTRLPILVLSQYVEPLYARELLASGRGSVGYLLKDRVADTDELVDAVRRVTAGGTALDPEVVSRLMARQTRPLDRLTAREREVLTLMAQGRSNTAIAQGLMVTERAVAKHINNIFTKLDLAIDGDHNRRVRAVLAYLDG